jgi:uncharacterized protein YbjT (DUF2867 family)
MKTILITGATGYVGGKLLNHLAGSKYHLKALARFPENLLSRLPQGSIEICQGDVLEAASLERALQGVEVAFYLVHSMGAKKSFETLDRQGAINFAKACKACGVHTIIYLGGLGSSHKKPLSPHMRSRHEVGDLLAAQGVNVLEFQSSIILGAGSLSYEMMRALVEKLPVMICPKWVNCQVQPIHIDDVLNYLMEAIEKSVTGHKIIEIGGADVVSYKDFMKTYAELRGLHRTIFIVPLLTPYLSSLWLGLVTPLYKRIGRKLIESIVNDSVVMHPQGQREFSVQPKHLKQALEICIAREGTSKMDRRWYDAVSSKGPARTFQGITFRKQKGASYTTKVKAPCDKVYAAIQMLGGKNGWYGQWLWKLRGMIDLLFGGVGFRRLRRDPVKLIVGDPVDFWRVVEMIENQKILLKAEMKLPGLAFLNFEVKPLEDGSTLLKVEPFFLPIGFFGDLYWYAMAPFHAFIFRGLLRKVKKLSEKLCV